MNAFTDAQEVERRALADLLPYALKRHPGIEITPTDNYKLLQKVCGDWMAKWKGKGRLVEIKAEEENKYDNLFLEAWSNRPRGTPGWMDTCQADWLWYYFVENKQLFILSMRELKEWAFGAKARLANENEFKMKPQKKRDQPNETWGWCVPIATLDRELDSFKGPIDPTK